MKISPSPIYSRCDRRQETEKLVFFLEESDYFLFLGKLFKTFFPSGLGEDASSSNSENLVTGALAPSFILGATESLTEEAKQIIQHIHS